MEDSSLSLIDELENEVLFGEDEFNDLEYQPCEKHFELYDKKPFLSFANADVCDEESEEQIFNQFKQWLLTCQTEGFLYTFEPKPSLTRLSLGKCPYFHTGMTCQERIDHMKRIMQEDKMKKELEEFLRKRLRLVQRLLVVYRRAKRGIEEEFLKNLSKKDPLCDCKKKIATKRIVDMMIKQFALEYLYFKSMKIKKEIEVINCILIDTDRLRHLKNIHKYTIKTAEKLRCLLEKECTEENGKFEKFFEENTLKDMARMYLNEIENLAASVPYFSSEEWSSEYFWEDTTSSEGALPDYECLSDLIESNLFQEEAQKESEATSEDLSVTVDGTSEKQEDEESKLLREEENILTDKKSDAMLEMGEEAFRTTLQPEESHNIIDEIKKEILKPDYSLLGEASKILVTEEEGKDEEEDKRLTQLEINKAEIEMLEEFKRELWLIESFHYFTTKLRPELSGKFNLVHAKSIYDESLTNDEVDETVITEMESSIDSDLNKCLVYLNERQSSNMQNLEIIKSSESSGGDLFLHHEIQASDQNAQFDQNAPFDKYSQFDQNAPFDKYSQFDQNAPFDKYSQFDQNAPFDKYSQFDQNDQNYKNDQTGQKELSIRSEESDINLELKFTEVQHEEERENKIQQTSKIEKINYSESIENQNYDTFRDETKYSEYMRVRSSILVIESQLIKEPTMPFQELERILSVTSDSSLPKDFPARIPTSSEPSLEYRKDHQILSDDSSSTNKTNSNKSDNTSVGSRRSSIPSYSGSLSDPFKMYERCLQEREVGIDEDTAHHDLFENVSTDMPTRHTTLTEDILDPFEIAKSEMTFNSKKESLTSGIGEYSKGKNILHGYESKLSEYSKPTSGYLPDGDDEQSDVTNGSKCFPTLFEIMDHFTKAIKGNSISMCDDVISEAAEEVEEEEPLVDWDELMNFKWKSSVERRTQGDINCEFDCTEFIEKLRKSNTQYMRNHPEMSAVISLILREVSLKKPQNGFVTFIRDTVFDKNFAKKLSSYLAVNNKGYRRRSISGDECASGLKARSPNMFTFDKPSSEYWREWGVDYKWIYEKYGPNADRDICASGDADDDEEAQFNRDAWDLAGMLDEFNTEKKSKEKGADKSGGWTRFTKTLAKEEIKDLKKESTCVTALANEIAWELPKDLRSSCQKMFLKRYILPRKKN